MEQRVFLTSVVNVTFGVDYNHIYTETSASGPCSVLQFQFDTEVAVAPNLLTLENTTTGQIITGTDVKNVYGPTSAGHNTDKTVVDYTFPNAADTDAAGGEGLGLLDSGWWIARLNAGSITALADPGNSLAQDSVINIPILKGDVDHAIYSSGGTSAVGVDLADYGIAIQNFGLNVPANATIDAAYSFGDVNYDGTVDLNDYGTVIGQFGVELHAPPATAGDLAISNDPTDPHHSLDLTWSAPASGTVDHYTLQYSDDGETFYTLADNIAPNGALNHYPITGLDEGSRHWYRVRAAFTHGSGAPLTYSTYSPKQALSTTLSAVSAVTATPGAIDATAGTVPWNVSWTNPGTEATGYTIYYAPGNAPNLDLTTAQQISVNGGSATSTTIPGLIPNTPYTVWVQAHNSNTAAAAIPAAGSVFHLGLNEGSGLTATDDIGGQTLAVPPGVTWAPGRVGTTGLAFNGSASLTASDENLPEGSSPRTLSVWFKTSATSTGTQQLLTYGQTGTAGASSAALLLNSSNQLALTDNGTALIATTSTVNDGNWHLATATFDSSTWSVYLDDSLIGSASASTNTSPGPLFIGGTAGSYFTGTLDEPRIFNTALTGDQVESLFASAGPILSFTGTPTLNQLSWTPVTGATTYDVYAGDSSGGESATPFATGLTATQFVDTSLTSGQRFYQIAAVIDGVPQSKSNEVSIALPEAPPTGLAATTVSTSEIDLSWATNPLFSDAEYEVKATPAGSTTSTCYTTTAAGWIAIANLNDNSAYTFHVRMKRTSSPACWSHWSDPTTATTLPAAPGQPTTTLLAPMSVQVDWSPGTTASSTVPLYTIQRAISLNGIFQSYQTVGTSSGTSFTDTNLIDGKKYKYQIIANGVAGDSAPSTASANTQVVQAVDSVTAMPLDSTDIKIDWAYTGTATTNSYLIFLVPGTAGIGNATPIPEPTGTSTLTVNNLTPGTLYTAYVEVKRPSGFVSAAVSDTATTADLAAPTGMSFVPLQDDEMAVSWNALAEAKDGYTITYSPDGSANGNQVPGASGTIFVPTDGTTGTATKVLTGLSPGQQYDIAINAVSGSGQYETANSSFETPPVNYNHGTPVGTITAGVDGNTTSFGAQPAGLYRIQWVSGIMSFHYGEDGYWGVDWGSPSFSYHVSDGTADFSLGGPGPSQTADQAAAAVAANPPSVTFDHTTNGPIGVYLQDSPYDDNQGSVNWELVRLTDTPVLAPPQSVQTSAVSANSVNLNWGELTGSHADGFQIEVSTGGGAYSTLATLGAGVSSYAATGLAPSTAYSFRVSGLFNGAASQAAAPITVTTPGASPAVPDGFYAASADTVSVTLKWTDVAGITFDLYRQTSPGVAITPDNLVDTGLTGGQFVDSNVSSQTTYYYRLVAVAGDGTVSAPSPETSAFTGTQAPPTPTGLTVTDDTGAGTSLNVSWTENDTPSSRAEEYDLEYTTDLNSGDWQSVPGGPVGTTQYTFTNADPATRYFFRVSAVNQYGGSDPSLIVGKHTYPALPTIDTIQATPGLRWIAISGTVPSGTIVDGYRVYIQDENPAPDDPNGTNWTPLSVLHSQADFQLTTPNLTGGHSYAFKVIPYNHHGDGTPATIAATTLPELPAAPTPHPGKQFLESGLSEYDWESSWTDNSDNETGFYATVTWVHESGINQQVGTDVQSYTIPSDNIGGPHDMTKTDRIPSDVNTSDNAYVGVLNVDAYNATGLSSETQLATPPSDLVVARSTPTSATLTWTDVNDPTLKILTSDHNKDISAEQGKYIDMTLPGGGVDRVFVTPSPAYGANGRLIPNRWTTTITGLEALANYYFSAGAWTKLADASSPWTEAVRIKTSTALTTLTAVATGSDTIHLTWNQNTTNMVLHAFGTPPVTVERSDDNGETWREVTGGTYGADNTNNTAWFDDTSLDAGTYQYRLVQTPGVPYSNQAEATTWGAPIQSQPDDDPSSATYPPGVPNPNQMPGSPSATPSPDPTPTPTPTATAAPVSGGPGLYQVTIGEKDDGDSGDDGVDVTGDLSINTSFAGPSGTDARTSKWFEASSQDDAIRQAIGGTLTADYTDGVSETNNFLDSSFKISGLSGNADGTVFTGTILMDTDRLEGSLDWDDQNWSVTVKKAKLDLEVDSNNDGTIDPATDGPIKATAPGKYIPVNDADVNGNGIPDFADGYGFNGAPSAAIAGESFTPMTLTIPIGIDPNSTVSFNYTDSNPSLVTKTGNGSAYNPYVYSLPAAGGDVRLWMKDASSARTLSDYISPGVDYSLGSLGLSPGSTTTFYIEAVAPSSDGAQPISVSLTDPGDSSSSPLTDSVDVTVLKAGLGFNAASDDPSKLEPTTPDTSFTINASDEYWEKLGAGMNWWWNSSTSDAVQETDLEDLAPFDVNIPQSLLNSSGTIGFELAASTSDPSDKFWIYPNVSPSTDRTAFMTTKAGSERGAIEVLADPPFTSGAKISLNLIQQLQAGDNEFLLRASGSGSAVLRFSLVFSPSHNLLAAAGNVILDTAIVSVNDPSQYYTLISARGNGTPTIPFQDPTEQGGTVNMNVFPWSFATNHIDSNIDNALIFVHGFNVSDSDATTDFAEAYKRAFWQGFRGNFIGFSWYGDPPPLSSALPGGNGSGSSLASLNFNGAVQNALETSATFLSFLSHLESPSSAGGNGISPNNVNVMAHSLGNLVVSNALRIDNAMGGSAIIHNFINAESAVWADAYKPLAPVTLPTLLGLTMTLSVQDLQKDSWLGYFVPAGAPTGAVAGNVINSFYSGDQALQIWKRENDYVFNCKDKALLSPPRNDTNLSDTPSIWSTYWPDSLSVNDVGLAVGTIPNPAAQVNIDASQYGWGNSDSADGLHHSDFLDEPYPDIFPWWQKILSLGVPLGRQTGS